jgi:enoyl-CoA hydratase/carnithine racemase
LTLALAHGRNFGAGVDLVGACRLRIASADASFRMPGLKFGLVLGTRRFGAIVGAAQARAILQEARTFDAAQAQAMGFVERVAAPSDWVAAVAAARDAAMALDAPSRTALYERLGSEAADADLAALVRSAARPGLKDRIATYLRGG